MAYASFNLGVALVRANRLAEADPILTAVGTLNTASPEAGQHTDAILGELGYSGADIAALRQRHII